MKLFLEERDDLQPICPHCREMLERLYYRQLRDPAGRRVVRPKVEPVADRAPEEGCQCTE